MPYITLDKRARFIEPLANLLPDTVGELNYCISSLIDFYLQRKGLSYEQLNAVAGVVSCVDKEIYRRITAEYEDQKLFENGEVFQILEEKH